MKFFKDIAYHVLKMAGKALHSEEITRKAIKAGLLKSSGKTPAATMAAQLYMDVNAKGKKSRFLKKGHSTFALNPAFKDEQAPKKAQALKGRILTEDFVKNAVIKWLSSNGWGHFRFGDLHCHGPDIQAKHHRYSRYYFVEIKGGKYDEVGFIYSLGQIITRMKTSKTTRYYYGIGLPQNSANIALRRLPWQVAKKLLLCVFSVDGSGAVTQYTWKELRKYQHKELKNAQR